MTAVELLPPGEAIPDNPGWHELRRAGVTASEIAVVMGLSKWDSPFNLYWSKVNGWRGDDSEIMSTGRHLEEAIADWWWGERACVLSPAGLYAHPERPWQLATPDRLVTEVDASSLLECKWVAYSWDGWGEPDTDDIPVHYRAQALWQADVMGVDEVHIAALGPGGFRSYLVRRDERAEEDLRLMRLRGARFMAQLNGELPPPDIDSHAATLGALQRLHPDLGRGDVQVDVEFAERYRLARAEEKAAAERVAQCEAEIRALLGSDFNRVMCGKKLVASRSIYEQSGDSAELTALEDDWPVVDRLNPGRADSYA